MATDPRTPVLVGAGQVLQRPGGIDDALEPAALMADAVRAAAADAGLSGVPPALDSIRVVRSLSWRYRDPGLVVAEELGVTAAETAMTGNGGNSPQMLVNTTAAEIAAGRLDLAVLTGGECWRTRMRAQRQGARLTWKKAPEGASPTPIGHDEPMSNDVETAIGIVMPVQLYPIFETALRAAAGEDVDAHTERISELWSWFSVVAATNPNAWVRTRLSAEQIRTVGPGNRMIGLPYPKYMNSNNDVDMAAALILCSAERAEALGISRDRWVFPVAGADCHDHLFVSNRADLCSSPAVRIAGRAVLDAAGMGLDDIDLVDLYSCFPSAVQMGATALGLPLDWTRPLTRTGGLTFAGGPWNNYPMHAIATVAGELRANVGRRALVWANGGYATKHALGIYATEPPAAGFTAVKPQAEVDAEPSRVLAEPADAVGPATIEGYTVMHDRDGAPETAWAACLLADGRRAWGRSGEADLVTAMTEGEWVGRAVTLGPEAELGV